MESSQKTIKNRILTEAGGLREALSCAEEFRATHLIREWVYQNTVVADIGTQEALQLPIWIIPFGDLEMTQKLFDENKLGGVCGEINIYLAQIYRVFGFQSTVYNFGYSGTPLTHMVSLVFCPEENKCLIQDAYYNGCYCVENHPLDYFQLKSLGENESINFSSGFSQKKREISIEDGKQKISEVSFSIKNGLDWIESIRKGVRLNTEAVSFEKLIRSPLYYLSMGVPGEEEVMTNMMTLASNSESKITYLGDPRMGDPLFDNSTLAKEIVNSLDFQTSSVKIAIYGMSSIGYALLNELLRNKITNIRLIDGDSSKQQFNLFGYQIEDLNTLREFEPDLVIVCSVNNSDLLIENSKKVLGKEIHVIRCDQI